MEPDQIVRRINLLLRPDHRDILDLVKEKRKTTLTEICNELDFSISSAIYRCKSLCNSELLRKNHNYYLNSFEEAQIIYNSYNSMGVLELILLENGKQIITYKLRLSSTRKMMYMNIIDALVEPKPFRDLTRAVDLNLSECYKRVCDLKKLGLTYREDNKSRREGRPVYGSNIRYLSIQYAIGQPLKISVKPKIKNKKNVLRILKGGKIKNEQQGSK